MLKKALEDRIAALARSGSWPEIIADLDSLTETEIEHDGKRFVVRSAPRPAASLALRAAGVALPPTVREARPLIPPEPSFPTMYARGANCKGLCSSAATDALLCASHKRWKPPMPFRATMRPSLSVCAARTKDRQWLRHENGGPAGS